MTNPDNIVRVRARNGGRASVYEANGWGQAYSNGLIRGNGVIQNTSADMNVLVGGSASKPDVVLAENPAGYKFALDIVGQQAVAITAPASNSRISAIVAYTDDVSLPTTEDTVTGSPSSCGLIVVNGTAAADPSEPSDAQIRTAITSDGATGSQAAYCVIATILVANTTTIITDSLITNKKAQPMPYENGDTLTIGNGTDGTTNVDYIITSGLLTSSRAEMVFSVTLPGSLVDISSVTMDSSKVYIRHTNGGYVLQGADLVSASTSMAIGIVADNTITISAVKTGGWTDGSVPNNSPLVIEGGFNFTFS